MFIFEINMSVNSARCYRKQQHKSIYLKNDVH